MVKKLQKSADKSAADSTPPPPSGLLDSQLAQTIKDSAHQIWLAGLGAFAKAQGGGKVFETLMKEGGSLQRKTQAAAEEKLGDVADKMTAMAGEVGHKANAQWDKLEGIFEQRTARALGKLGVPSAKALADLADRVEALAAAVAALQRTAAPAAAPKFKPGKAMAGKPAKAASKPAAQPAARKRSAKTAALPAVAAPEVAVRRGKPRAAGSAAAAAASPATAPSAPASPVRRKPVVGKK